MGLGFFEMDRYHHIAFYFKSEKQEGTKINSAGDFIFSLEVQ
jgi:hypothetical protein